MEGQICQGEMGKRQAGGHCQGVLAELQDLFPKHETQEDPESMLCTCSDESLKPKGCHSQLPYTLAYMPEVTDFQASLHSFLMPISLKIN